ncbi:hypothetical protein PoB_007126100 [Plakobranchus ocellatus]|uniref:Uncharacterized protein n=1 Tax=Plakobranchus ocellatus TaxID=259542 RepID=A0AAV4DLB3_9GAST|nr:hypothetical protein PoB_007126100 [Plakobranchus ocellatus]
MECYKRDKQVPKDATQIPLCYKPPPDPTLPRGPNCGCPMQDEGCTWQCRLAGPLETRIFKRPKRYVKPVCDYRIPAIPCEETKGERQPSCNPLCFDWTVDEPGPNDSYGLNGLNLYDWQMENINKYAMVPTAVYVPEHPGYSKIQAPENTPIYLCRLPIECYARSPGPWGRPSPFANSVNYFRDFRCCASKPPPPWKPPCVRWATNQSL